MNCSKGVLLQRNFSASSDSSLVKNCAQERQQFGEIVCQEWLRFGGCEGLICKGPSTIMWRAKGPLRKAGLSVLGAAVAVAY